MWKQISAGQAYTCWRRLALYGSPRGHRVVNMEKQENWFVITYTSGGKRHVRAEHQLWWKEE